MFFMTVEAIASFGDPAYLAATLAWAVAATVLAWLVARRGRSNRLPSWLAAGRMSRLRIALLVGAATFLIGGYVQPMLASSITVALHPSIVSVGYWSGPYSTTRQVPAIAFMVALVTPPRSLAGDSAPAS